MQINNLKSKTARRKKKVIGRGGKKGTYSGRGMKGQKARSGVSINPLFEGGRSALIDRMKKNRGFKAITGRRKNVFVKIADLEKSFQEGDMVSRETLVKAGLIENSKKIAKIKVIGEGNLKKKLSFSEEIIFSASAKKSVGKKEKKEEKAADVKKTK